MVPCQERHAEPGREVPWKWPVVRPDRVISDVGDLYRAAALFEVANDLGLAQRDGKLFRTCEDAGCGLESEWALVGTSVHQGVFAVDGLGDRIDKFSGQAPDRCVMTDGIGHPADEREFVHLSAQCVVRLLKGGSQRGNAALVIVRHSFTSGTCRFVLPGLSILRQVRENPCRSISELREPP